MVDEYNDLDDSYFDVDYVPNPEAGSSSATFDSKISDLFKLGLFREITISPTEKAACCNYCSYVLILSIILPWLFLNNFSARYNRKKGNLSTGNMWRHIRKQHPERIPDENNRSPVSESVVISK